jgi:hypothetical protein
VGAGIETGENPPATGTAAAAPARKPRRGL